MSKVCSLRESNETPNETICDETLKELIESKGDLANMLSDYANASPIPSTCPLLSPNVGKENRLPAGGYIAAQAPIGVSIGIFWQMIWESKVEIIVMLTR